MTNPDTTSPQFPSKCSLAQAGIMALSTEKNDETLIIQHPRDFGVLIEHIFPTIYYYTY